tara:strand:- start:7 stop:204 length:198 start_codon:yes stop_codon:yes gene_type:complete
MKHASELFPDVARQLIAIGDKARKQREKGERVKQASKASFTRACKQVVRKEKQAKQLQLQLQTRI